MEGKFDSFEQLFPWVHHRDANRHSPRRRHRCVRVSRHNGSVEPVDGVYRTPRGLRIAADAVSWLATRSGGPGGQHAEHIRHGRHHHHRRRTRRARAPTVRDRVVAAAGPIDHRIVGRFSIAVPQSGDSVGSSVGATRRGRQTPAAGRVGRRALRPRPSASGWQPSDTSPSASRRRKPPSVDE